MLAWLRTRLWAIGSLFIGVRVQSPVCYANCEAIMMKLLNPQIVALVLAVGATSGAEASAFQLNVVEARVGLAPGGSFGSRVYAVPALGGGPGEDVLVLELAGAQLGSLSRYGPGSQTRIWLLSGTDVGSQMGINSSVTLFEDWTGDGVPELLLGISPGCRLIVVDGATGAQVSEISNPLPCGLFAVSAFGTAAGLGADYNGDGIRDLYSGDPLAGLGGNDAGALLIIDAVSGALLAQTVGLSAGDFLGSQVIFADNSVLGVGGDLIVSSSGGTGSGSSAGEVSVLDAITLQPRFSLLGAGPGSRFGSTIALLGDLDADGYSEIVVGAPFEVGPGGLSGGAAYVFSGQSGALMARLDNGIIGDRFGHVVAAAGDVNGDGVPDIVVSSLGAQPSPSAVGTVWTWSGADFRNLDAFQTGVAGDELGRSIVGVGDSDGDGFDDFVVGTASPDGPLATPVPGEALTLSSCACSSANVCSVGGLGSSLSACWSGTQGELQLVAVGLPVDVPGYLVVGDQAGQLPLGFGLLCVAGNVQRLILDGAGIAWSDGDGTARLNVSASDIDSFSGASGESLYVHFIHPAGPPTGGGRLSGAIQVIIN